MTTFHSFKDSEAWKKGRKVTRKIRAICKRQNVKNDFAFVDQITRSARSITANIAEGNGSLSAGSFITFLGYAKRSAAELHSHLFDALDEGYVCQEEFDSLSMLCIEIQKMIAGLIHYLQKNGNRFVRTQKTKN